MILLVKAIINEQWAWTVSK